MELTFNRGTILVRGDVRIPDSTWDERSKRFRAMALHYRDIVDYLNNSKIGFTDNVLDLIPCPELHSNIILRDYQKQALEAWILNSKRGVIVLPTGSGKTVIGIKAIAVVLTAEEQKEYELNQGIFADYLRRCNITVRTPLDFQKIVIRSGRDPNARKALLARNKARDIALNSVSKIEKFREILKKHKESRLFIFTEHNKLVHKISQEFLIPAITYRTATKERGEILDRFRSGVYRAVVTSKVLDEGIDVPEADVGVILSGTGSGRAFIQRLGRILRKKEGKEAVRYKMVSAETSEINTAKRRNKALR